MRISLRKTIAVGYLCSQLLFTAGCTITLPPRLERNMAKIRLADEWGKIVQYTGIDGERVMLSDFIVRSDTGGTVENFRLQFYSKDSDISYTLHNVSFNGGDEIKYSRTVVSEPIGDAVRVSNVFAEIDAYGFGNLGRGISGPVGIMMSTVWGKTSYRSGSNCKVYLLAGGEITPVENQTFELGKEHIALNVWEESENPTSTGSTVFIIRDEAPAAVTEGQ